jgi:hypothetical protein
MTPLFYRLLTGTPVASLLILAGCVVDLGPSGPLRTETRSVDLDKSELVRVQVKMGAGELRVHGGSSKLMDAEFTYDRPAFKPEVRYDPAGFRGQLMIQEPSHARHHNSKDRWDIRLNDEKPIDLTIDFGAGEGRLDLGTLTLRSIEIHMGVGALRVDLRGVPKNDYNVNISGGVGEATIYLPENVGVVAQAKGGIGGVNARNLRKRDGEYVNDAYGHSKTTIRLDVKGGIGAINLVGG